MQPERHIPGSSIYFVKSEQVVVLPCLLCHSFPAAGRLYTISPSFVTVSAFRIRCCFLNDYSEIGWSLFLVSAVVVLLWEGW